MLKTTRIAVSRLLSPQQNGLFGQHRTNGAKLSRSLMPVLGRRNMFIEAHPTPNNNSLKFHPGRPVFDKGTRDFANPRTASASPLAEALFKISGVSSVFFGPDFVTVTKKHDELEWSEIKPKIISAIMDFYSSGAPLIREEAGEVPAAPAVEDDEVVTFIKELLDTRIRPSVQDDGGDISFIAFDAKTGLVTVRLQGACSTCSSSKVTLKQGVENMLMHYVPEVTEVMAVEDESEDPNDPVARAQRKFVEEMTGAGGETAAPAAAAAADPPPAQAAAAAGGGDSEREARARTLLADAGV